MKKLAIAAAAVAALSAGVANAYTAGTFANGFVVPNVIHNGAGDTTVVGLVNRSGGLVPVNWTFFDENSTHVRDGCFPMTGNDFHPFVWSAESGLDMGGRRGYLVFAVGRTVLGATPATICNTGAARLPNAIGAGSRIAGNALQVNAAAADVAYLPVVDGDLAFSADVLANVRNLRTLNDNDVVAATGAVNIDNMPAAVPAVIGLGVTADLPATQTYAMRYFIDNAAGGNDTSIVVWSSGDQRGSNPTVFMYNDAQADASVNLLLVNRELNLVNPEAIVGRPATFLDGFIEWTVTVPTFYPFAGGVKVAPAGAPAAATLADANYRVYSSYTYSIINAPAFGAVQTLLGAHHN